MTQIKLEDISTDELWLLKREIEQFVDIYDVAERAFCDGDSEYEGLNQEAEEQMQKVRNRIKGLALSLGIQAEFLDEYTALNKQYDGSLLKVA